MYSREIDGQTLTLAPSGWTYNSTFVLYDRETGSLWYPDRKGLMGIQGKYFKRRLPEIPSRDIQWGTWKSEYPYSKILR
ncbi:MAG: DUF3179 domain-containing protein [Proteobacteria bacterium]|nr:DUF3179 domain-containing protein [Pseudomonadota bacterium]NIS68262.1 DUF3179 domain-containing protein [Pseudomonadota bacterium]